MTEMISSEALVNNQKTLITKFDKEEYPLGFQLSGHKPHIMARAAKILNERASCIDLNFGCPVNKVVKGTDGSAMMRNVELAKEIALAVKEVIDVPLSAKFRLGWSLDEINFVEFAKKLESVGVDFVTIHGRTRSQMYSGNADWEKIGLLKNELKIPVFILLDADAQATAQTIMPVLRDIDDIYLIRHGEFEDIFSLNLIKRTVNNSYKNICESSLADFKQNAPMTKILAEFFRIHELGDFQKAEFAKELALNLKYKTDLTDEIKEIIDKIKEL